MDRKEIFRHQFGIAFARPSDWSTPRHYGYKSINDVAKNVQEINQKVKAYGWFGHNDPLSLEEIMTVLQNKQLFNRSFAIAKQRLFDLFIFKSLSAVEQIEKREAVFAEEEADLMEAFKTALFITQKKEIDVFPYVTLPDYGLEAASVRAVIDGFAKVYGIDKVDEVSVNSYFGDKNWKDLTSYQFATTCYKMAGWIHSEEHKKAKK